MDPSVLARKQLTELKGIASHLQMRGYQRLKKAELIDAIVRAAAGSPEGGTASNGNGGFAVAARTEEAAQLQLDAAQSGAPAPAEPAGDESRTRVRTRTRERGIDPADRNGGQAEADPDARAPDRGFDRNNTEPAAREAARTLPQADDTGPGEADRDAPHADVMPNSRSAQADLPAGAAAGSFEGPASGGSESDPGRPATRIRGEGDEDGFERPAARTGDYEGNVERPATRTRERIRPGSDGGDVERPAARTRDRNHGDVSNGADGEARTERDAGGRDAEVRGGRYAEAGEEQDGEVRGGGEVEGRMATPIEPQTDGQAPRGTGSDEDGARGDDDEFGGRRRRSRRERRRNKGQGGQAQGQPQGARQFREEDTGAEPGEVRSGVLDILPEGYGFLRTSGYLPGDKDVYVSQSQVRRHGLRRGDVVEGPVRQQRSNEKVPALHHVDLVNGQAPDAETGALPHRADFKDMTPLFPDERLRLETPEGPISMRIVDLMSPIGKGHRALIVSPPKAGKTTILKELGQAIAYNNPECHLMVVLVDERPEEVTDMQRSVPGEIIASTFDRPADDHTQIAERAIERAKRLVEQGQDVVILLDSITRLSRAYNLAAPASGRIMSGGVDSTALYPPKRFFGAARNIEDGGSLTIIASALIETGSKMDEVIFEEFKGTGNSEIRLDRRLEQKRVFPAIDIEASGTRKEELLLDREELAVIWKLRRVLHALDGPAALELLIDRMKQTRSNNQFLVMIQKSNLNTAGAHA